MLTVTDRECERICRDLDVILREMDLIGQIEGLQDVAPMIFPFIPDETEICHIVTLPAGKNETESLQEKMPEKPGTDIPEKNTGEMIRDKTAGDIIREKQEISESSGNSAGNDDGIFPVNAVGNAFMSIDEMRASLDSGMTTPDILFERAISAAERYQADFNCFVTILPERTNEENRDTGSPLRGIPYALKDNFATRGILTTGSSNLLKDYVPGYDSTVYRKLKEAGAVLVGKTVLDELAMGGTGTTGHTGIVRNPHDRNRSIGGSSSGSAAAVALGIVPFALGSDTGDSVRKPAAYGGVVGFKPTYGLISGYGLFPYAPSLDHVGCLTGNVRDAAYVTEAIRGYDEKDIRTLTDDGRSLVSSLDGDVSGRKLFYIREVCFPEEGGMKEDRMKENGMKENGMKENGMKENGMEENEKEENRPDGKAEEDDRKEILKIFADTIDKCRRSGMTVDEISFDRKLLRAVNPAYLAISCAEAVTNTADLSDHPFGPENDGKSIDEIIAEAGPDVFSENVKKRLLIGHMVLQQENREKYFISACRVRRLIVEKMTELFSEYDGMILPTSFMIAPEFEKTEEDRLSDRFLISENHLIIGNFGGFPGISVPAGFVRKMPVGITITGPVMDDDVVLNIASAIEKILRTEPADCGGKKETGQQPEDIRY